MLASLSLQWIQTGPNAFSHQPKEVTMISSCHNIFSNIPPQLPDERVDILLKNDFIQLERIVSKGHATEPGYWYDQAWDEWVLLLQGEAVLLFEKDMSSASLSVGDHLLIPAHTRHRVQWTSSEIETIWLAIHIKRQ
ncbi:MAG: cupin domain-containing protein [Gammaproteobacteria bacterium]